MSQVIVTNDALKDKRERSRQQEHRIVLNAGLAKWQRSSLKKNDPVTVVVGIAVLPIVAIWVAVVASIVLSLKILQFLFKVLGNIIGGSRSLITGK